MTTAPLSETASPVAAVLALTVAEVLGFGLPQPAVIWIHPWAADSAYVSAVDLTFTGLDRFTDLEAWAARFGTSVADPPPGRHYARAEFTHSGVRFEAAADTRFEH